MRSAYTLRYLRDPKLQRYVHRSQNRIESYHQLRAVIAQIGGKKELTGRTDLEIEISNQCARLVGNAIVFYNSAILLLLLTKYKACGNEKDARAHHFDIAGSLAAHPPQRALRLLRRRAGHRPWTSSSRGCSSGSKPLPAPELRRAPSAGISGGFGRGTPVKA